MVGGRFGVSLLPLDFWGNESAVYDYCDDDDAPDRANNIKKGRHCLPRERTLARSFVRVEYKQYQSIALDYPENDEGRSENNRD